jgi:succinoglycan biosynthesis transport protein ExoP
METQSLPGIGIKPLLSLQRHWRIGIVVGILVFLLGIPVVFLKGQSLYRAEGIFQVSPTYMKNLEADKELELQSNSQYREYVNHLSQTVIRYDVLESALDALAAEGIDPKPPALSRRRYIETLQRTIYVRPVADTYMVKVGIEGTDKRYLHSLINAVLASFYATSKAEQIYGSAERLQVLGETRERLDAEMAALEAERIELADALGLTTFAENVQNPFDAVLAQAREKATEATLMRAAAEAALAAFEQDGEVPTEFGRSLMEMRLQDNGLQALRNEVVKRSEELGRTLAGLTPEHPAHAAASREITEIRGRLAAAETAFDETTRANFRQRLATALAMRQQVERETTTMLKTLEDQASDYARRFQRAMRITADIDKREAELLKVRDRLNFLQTEADALGFVRLVTPALPAELPMGLGKTKLALAILIAAFGAALVAPVALDLLDRRILSVNDAEKLMEIPAAGWQIEREDEATRLFGEEQLRRFAATLIRNHGRSQRKVYAFSALKSGAGVSTLLLDTARMLTELGQRVLVLEANAWDPSEALAALKPGLSDWLDERAELAALPQTFDWQGSALQVIGIGEPSRGIRRLDRFRLALEQLGADHDFVLVDLPPLLQAADAELLIEAVGQVFLVVQAASITRGELLRGKRQLQRLDPEAVGLFVNRLPLFRGAGYLEEAVLETVTRTRYGELMPMSYWELQAQVLRTQAALWWRKLRRKQ